MKKLNLKMKGIGEMLSREQMKNVVGGDYGEKCLNQCIVDAECSTGKKCIRVTCVAEPSRWHLDCA